MTPTQKKATEKYLVGKGLVKGGGAQYGGFLGMLASIGVPLALDLVRKIIGKGLQTQPPRSRPRRTPPLSPHPKGKGMEIKLSQTQIQNTAQRGGSLFSAMLGLARPLIKPALGALASAGLSFGTEKVLKKIFGKGFGPKEIEL